MSATASAPNKNAVYQYVSPKSYKEQQFALEEEAVKLKEDKENANESDKKFFDEKIKEVKSKQEKNKENLITFFDSLTKKEKKEYAKNIDKQNEALNIIGNNKYSEQTQSKAKEDLRKYTEANNKFFESNDVAYDSDLEQIIGRTLKASERIQEQKGFFGFNKKNLDVKYLTSESEIKELSEKFKGFDTADGMFVAQDKNPGVLLSSPVILPLTIASRSPLAYISKYTSVPLPGFLFLALPYSSLVYCSPSLSTRTSRSVLV